MRFIEKNRISPDKTYGVTESVQWGTFYKNLCKKHRPPPQPPNEGFKSKSKTVNAPVFISWLLILKVLKKYRHVDTNQNGGLKSVRNSAQNNGQKSFSFKVFRSVVHFVSGVLKV